MIIESVVIGILAIVGLYFLKMEHHTRKIKIIVIALIILLFYVSATGMFNSGNVDVTSPRGIVSGIYLYVGWLGESAASIWDIGVETTGRVVDAVRIEDED
tara:strand:+ start:159 stop:461 length:303 start_codon:yes stop_codon:yes gene_type:complete